MNEHGSGLAAAEAYWRARAGRGVIGWKLLPAEREALLERFPPRYANTVAHHVTLRARVGGQSPLPAPARGEIIGRSDDGLGVEALVVRIAGSSERPGGGTYHVTWSLEPGRRPVESNDVIRERRWTPIDPPVPLQLEPARF